LAAFIFSKKDDQKSMRSEGEKAAHEKERGPPCKPSGERALRIRMVRGERLFSLEKRRDNPFKRRVNSPP